MSRIAVAFALLALVAVRPWPAVAGRCNPGAGLGGELLCSCPNYDQVLPTESSIRVCPPGWTTVVYDMDKPFPPDGTMSNWAVTGNSTSCPAYQGNIRIRGQLVGCWSPQDHAGCREFKTPFEGQCFSLDSTPLGGSCSGSCASVETGFLAIGNAGSGSYRVCPPVDPSTSCRAVGLGGKPPGKFRFQTGGWCLTGGCTTGDPTVPGGACRTGWGATYFGSAFGVPQGWYDWKTGTFKVETNMVRGVCGRVRDCLGDRVAGVMTAVGVPEVSPIFGKPPCIPGTKPGDPCNPADCVP